MIRLTESDLKEITKKEHYKFLQDYFDDSGCNRQKFVGHCMEMIKNKQPQDFNEWVGYYTGHDGYLFTSGLVDAAMVLQNYVETHTKRKFKFTKYWEAVSAFVLFHTWNGYKMELKAIEELKGNNYSILQTNSKQDELYAIDLIAYKENKPLLGIQVKPSKYFKMSEEKKKLNKNKNQQFINKYNVGVKYLYYDENYEFSREDIEKTKRKIIERIKGVAE